MSFSLFLLLASSQTVMPGAPAALRANARTALPETAFPPGLSVVDEQGKAVSVVQGLATIKMPRILISRPARAFVMRSAVVMAGISAAQVDMLASTGVPRT